MKQLDESETAGMTGGGNFESPALAMPGPSTAYIEAILALLTPTRTVHHAD